MNPSNHVLKTDLLAFQRDTMDQKDRIIFLEHIASCDFCSDQFASIMSEDIIAAPRDMKENILKATRRPEVQLAVKVKETSKRMQLFIYSLKVGTATIGALLLLLLSMNFNDFTNVSKDIGSKVTDIVRDDEDSVSITSSIRSNMDTISNSMLDFSNNIMKTEVTDNDQKEK